MLPMRFDSLKDMNRELSTLHREVDDLFRRTFGLRQENMPTTAAISPPVNCFVKENMCCIQMEVPGVEKKDLDISVEGNMLTIRGEKKMSREVKEQDFMLNECMCGSFMRRMTLPDGVDTEKIKATCKDGMLEITMPMTAKNGQRKIEIEMQDAQGESKELH